MGEAEARFESAGGVPANTHVRDYVFAVFIMRGDSGPSRQLSLHRAILCDLPLPVIVSDPEARVLFLNDSAEKLLRCTQNVVGRPISSVMTLVNSPSGLQTDELVEQVLGGGSAPATALEADLVTNAGGQTPVELVASPLRLGGDDIAGVILTLRDRTDEQHAERQAQRLLETAESEREWFSQVLNSIADEVYFTDTARRYTYANPAAMREFGHDSVQGVEVAKVIENLVVLRADGSPRPIAEAPPLRALGGEVIRDEEQIVHTPRTGEFRHRQVSAAPVHDRNGRIIGSVSVVRDITVRKRAEAALREAARREDVFLATLSHELRIPLAPIRTAAQLLDAPAVGAEELQRCRTIVSRQVAHLSSLLDDLLDVSRLVRGEMTLELATAPLAGIVDAAVEAAEPLIASRSHRLLVHGPAEPLLVRVDPVRITQVLSSLLTNAAKFTAPGGEIALDCTADPEGLTLAVRDCGTGLDADGLREIFDLFVQRHAPLEGQGLGIGLARARALVELHGGRIEAQSAGQGRGSTFTVLLPASVVVRDPATTSQGDGPAANPEKSASPRRILVVDSNADAADALAMFLRQSGHTVHAARSGAQALEIASRVQPEFVLLDVEMPESDGYGLAARIRGEPWAERVTLIALTGRRRPDDISKAEAAGFDRHFVKPVDPEQLIRALASRGHAAGDRSD